VLTETANPEHALDNIGAGFGRLPDEKTRRFESTLTKAQLTCLCWQVVSLWRESDGGLITMTSNPMLDNPHKLKLGVFGLNVSGGCSMTRAENTLQANWAESKRIAQMAEKIGLDAIIPVARWKGMGGDTNFNHRNFEPFTWAAGLAAVTERIALFATCHVPTVHPVRVAKEFATVDQIADGRFCLNIVAGWNEKEIAMFGVEQVEHDTRYTIAEDWISLIKALWTTEGEFNYEGPHFNCPGAYSEPKPVQREPVIMSAGNSPRGQQFVAEHAHLNFVVAPNLEAAAKNAEQVKALAAEKGRSLQVFGQAYIVCRDTEAQAQAYRERYVQELGDWDGVRNLLDVLIPNSKSALGDQWEQMAENMIAGYGAMPLVGTADQIVEALVKFSEAGLDGTTLSWVDYEAGLEQFGEKIYPRLIEAGLRDRTD
jgi:FMNH2-dependent dimethyl sulfone monooxygenase